VARVTMAGLEFCHEIPFRNVYFTGIIRDAQRRKMSKSLGNSPDPLVLVEKYGADALRFGIMLIAPQGQDILFSEERLEVGRNFMNKVWNAARFVLMNLDENTLTDETFDPTRMQLELADEWILCRLNDTIRSVDKNLKKYRFDTVARTIYDFVWSDYCDWYIELIKDRLYKKSPAEKQTALRVAVYVLKNFLKLLHPYAPFITEEIYQHIKLPDEPDIIVSAWPKVEYHPKDKTLTERFQLLQEIVTALRTARSEMNISPAVQIELIVRVSDSSPLAELLNNSAIQNYIKNLVKVTQITFTTENAKPAHSSTVVVRGSEFFIPLEGVIDIATETARLTKEINRLTGLLKGVNSKLSNPDFLTRAPREIINKEREKEQILREQLDKFKANLKMLSD